MSSDNPVHMVNMVWEQHEYEKLISLVSAHSILYNKKHTQHYNHILRESVWEDVALQINKTSQQCKTRWLKLLGNYIHYRQKLIKTGQKDPRAYTHLYEKMTFLDEVLDDNPRQNRTNRVYSYGPAKKSAENPTVVGLEYMMLDKPVFIQETEGTSSKALPTRVMDEDLEEIRVKQPPKNFDDPQSSSTSSDDSLSDTLSVIAKRCRLNEPQKTIEIKSESNSLNNNDKKNSKDNNSNQNKGSENTILNQEKDLLIASYGTRIQQVLKRLPWVDLVQAKEDFFNIITKYEKEAGKLANIRGTSSVENDTKIHLCEVQNAVKVKDEILEPEENDAEHIY